MREEENFRSKLTPRKERVARIIAGGDTQKKAADDLGVTKQTVNAWMKDENLQGRIEQLRTDAFKQAEDILIDSAVEAAKTVRDIAIGEDFTDSKILTARLKASLYILDLAKRTKIPAIKQNSRTQNIDTAIAGMDEEEIDEMLDKFDDD
jgi:DNA-binding XRE family transcriptional regulator